MINHLLCFRKIASFIILCIYSSSFSDHLPFQLIDSIGKIQIGYGKTYSKDSTVIQYYGKEGYYNRDEGHGGGIYYLDTSHKHTFHYEIGVDGVIDMVEILSGNRIPDTNRNNLQKYVCPSLSKNVPISHNLRIGQNPTQVIKLIGKPVVDSIANKSRILIYRVSEEQMMRFNILFYEAKLVFIENKLIEISVYSGE